MAIPTNYTFVITYSNSINAERGNGLLAGTAIGGATVVSEHLDLAHNDVRYVNYSATGNVVNQQTGALKFMYTPNYNGMPASDQIVFSNTKADGYFINNISFYHAVDSNIYFTINDQTGASLSVPALYFWAPVLGHEYEIEINYDITAGNIYLFIDGQLKAHLTGHTGIRSAAIGLFAVGCSWDSISTPATNFKISKLIVFSTVQHTASYTPGYCLNWVKEYVPHVTTVFGFVKYPDDSSANAIRVHATAGDKYNYDNLQIYLSDVEVVTNSIGYWYLNLIENTTTQIPYTITFYLNNDILKQYTNVIIPDDVSCVDFSSLV